MGNLKNNSDLLNVDKLDDDFYNAIGSCGTPPLPCVPKQKFKQKCVTVLGKKICTQVPDGLPQIEQSCKDRINNYKKCVENNAKAIADKAKKDAQYLADKAKKDAQDALKNVKETTQEAIKSTKEQLKEAEKNIKSTAKELSNKAKKALQKLLGKAVLGMAYTAIRTNELGIATKLYPAISNPKEIKDMKIKASFVPKSKLSYSQILAKWKANGGNQDKLNEAIRLGAKIRFGKKGKVSFDGVVFHNADGREDEELLYPVSEPNVTNTEIPADEESAYIDETGGEEVGEEQKMSGWKKFLAFIMNIFRRNKASDESPYEDGTSEADSYIQDISSMANEIKDIEGTQPDGDITVDENLPISDNNDNSTMREVSSDKMFGVIPKPVFWIGLGVLALVGGLVTYKIIKNK